MFTNFVQDLLTAITRAGKKEEDVLYIADMDSYASLSEVLEQCSDLTFDDGYGVAEVNIDLVVMFSDGSWLARVENSGLEQWEHTSVPPKPEVCRVPEILPV
jgi:hypothetical protein